MMEVLSNYPPRKIVIEFQDREIYANGRKYRDVEELIQWIKDCDRLNKNMFIGGYP